MKVKDIIATALRFVGREEISRKISPVDDACDADLTDEESEVIETMLYCFNSVEDELARCYIPLETKENLSSESGVYNYSDFSLRPVKIISVSAADKKVEYSITPLSLIADSAEITVRYGYAPLKKGIDGESAFSSVLANERLVAAGIASEYCLIDGEAKLAETWESIYRNEIETLQRTRLSALRLPPRRWV